jgi:hypothetical protein
MRIVLDRFCKFACEFSRFCPISAGEGSRLTRRDRSFEPKNWTEGEELLFTIQASFAREFTTAECANVLLEPYCSAAIVELLTLQGKSQPLRAKSAQHSGKLPGGSR